MASGRFCDGEGSGLWQRRLPSLSLAPSKGIGPIFGQPNLVISLTQASTWPEQLDGAREKPRQNILLSTVVQVLRSRRSQDSEGSGNPARQPVQLSEHTRDFSPWYMLPAVPGS